MRLHCRTFKACEYSETTKITTCNYEKYTCESKMGKEF